MLDLNAVHAFVQVVESRTFRGAATVLGVPKSTVSRKVAELEANLGAQLLLRTTRQVRLTEAGANYHRQAAAALGTLQDAARGVDQLQSQPRGLLRISVPVAMAQTMLGKLLEGFLAAYPDVEVAADVSDRRVDLHQEGFDVALRAGALPDSSLVARKLAESRSIVVASPSYLRGRPPVRKPADLKKHNCLVFATEPAPGVWPFRVGRRMHRVVVSGRCSVGSFPALLHLAEAGFGIARVPSFMADAALREHRLVSLLDRYMPPAVALHLVYPAARFVAPKVRAFVDHFVRHSAELLPPQTLTAR